MKQLCWIKAMRVLGVLALTTLAAWTASPATAQGPYCGGWGGGCGGWGVNFPYGLYGSRVDDVPYFAMFPPVYYSQPVPRSYGWSPFAYPPGTMTPEVTADVPQDITNPFVPKNGESKPAKPTTAHTAVYRPLMPQVLINPYVKAEGIASTASTQIASK